MSEARTSQLKGRQTSAVSPGEASNQNKIILPQNTTANLAQITNEVASIAYDTDQQSVVINDGTGFQPVGGGGGGGITDLTGDVEASGSGSVAATVTGLQGRPVDDALPADGDALLWNDGSSSWEPGSAANTTLSNLTSPVQFNQDLNFNTGAISTLISTPDTVGVRASSINVIAGNASGAGIRSGGVALQGGTSDRPGAMIIQGGDSTGTFVGSNIGLIAGSNFSTGNGGNVDFTSGDCNSGASPGDIRLTTGNDGTLKGNIIFNENSLVTATNGDVWTLLDQSNGIGVWAPSSGGGSFDPSAIDENLVFVNALNPAVIQSENMTDGNPSGDVILQSGSSDTSDSGGVTVITGDATTGPGDTGGLALGTGTADAGESGQIQIFSGDAPSSTGNVTVRTGDSTNDTAETGLIRLSTGEPGTDLNSGQIIMLTGDTSGTGLPGSIDISTGNAADNDSGNINMQTGNSATANRGYISMDAAFLRLPSGNVNPPNAVEGSIYWNTDDKAIRQYDGTDWKVIQATI